MTKLSAAATVREGGFYWVKKATASWRIAEWSASSKCWFVAGWENEFHDSEFDEIDERRVIRAL